MKPILFSTSMVQAIIDGRKTMTRRLVKNDDNRGIWAAVNNVREMSEYGASVPCYLHREISVDDKSPNIIYPKHDVGDILYVRETWTPFCVNKKSCRNSILSHPDYCYKATVDKDCVDKLGCKWRPSIHMPRDAARIFLRVTNVRVERLQEILCGDMRREGCIPETVTGGQYQQWQRDYWIPLWDSTIKKQDISLYGWDANPWVWVIEFERCEKP